MLSLSKQDIPTLSVKMFEGFIERWRVQRGCQKTVVEALDVAQMMGKCMLQSFYPKFLIKLTNIYLLC